MNPLGLAALSLVLVVNSVCGFVSNSQNDVRGGISMIHVNSDTEGVNMESNENHSGRRDFLAAATMSLGTFSLHSFPAFADGDDSTTLHILNYPVDGKCGEAKVPETGVFFAKTFGKLEDGSCAAEGYTVDEGTANGTGEKDSKRTYSIYGK